MNFTGLLIAAIGMFAVSGAAFDWDWFMNNYKARFLVKMISRTGARIFYGLLGSTLVVIGVLVFLGVLKNSS